MSWQSGKLSKLENPLIETVHGVILMLKRSLYLVSWQLEILQSVNNEREERRCLQENIFRIYMSWALDVFGYLDICLI